MTLKHVVLPAPLGPMRPRISPSLMWNETSFSATTPPKRSVTSSTSSSRRADAPGPVESTWVSVAGVVSGMCGPLLQGLDLLFGLDRPDGPAWRQQALRPEDRQGHQCQAEDQVALLGQEPELLGQPGQQEGRRDDAPAVALA